MTTWKKVELGIVNVLVVMCMVIFAEWLFAQTFVGFNWKIPTVFFMGAMSVFINILIEAIYEKLFGIDKEK